MFSNKPGTALASLIPEWAVQFKNGTCGCGDFAKRMDQWGADGCKQREPLIVSHLLSQDELLVPPLRALPKRMKARIAKRLVQRAIDLAKGK